MGGIERELEGVRTTAEVGGVTKQARVSTAPSTRPAFSSFPFTARYLHAIGLKLPAGVLAVQTCAVKTLHAAPLIWSLSVPTSAGGETAFAFAPLAATP